MSALKFLAFVAFLVMAVMATNVGFGAEAAYANKSHNLIIGARVPGDRLVLSDIVVKPSAWMKVQVAQKVFQIARYQRITQIKALDQKTNGNGAYASIVRGGLGHSNVTMKFKSQRGHGINFRVELYGK
ncbi:hypothetical protein KM043_003628 [Ampulex compressa]|nr:hypothetical protein KM043_003628 [Ampulex compressa]